MHIFVIYPNSYCVIVFNLPQRSSADYTNYCMDFGASRITEHKNFKYIRCREKQPRWVKVLIPEHSDIYQLNLNAAATWTSWRRKLYWACRQAIATWFTWPPTWAWASRCPTRRWRCTWAVSAWIWSRRSSPNTTRRMRNAVVEAEEKKLKNK